MEITGNIVCVTDEYIRIRTIKKLQEIDIFYPETKRKAIGWRFEPRIIARIEVEPQTIEIDGYKFAKLWFKYVTMPELGRSENRNAQHIFDLMEEQLYRKKNSE
jgi:hypothetical protein